MTSKARNIADLGSNDVIETTSTGVDVTGTVTADGLTVDGSSDQVVVNGTNSAGATLVFLKDNNTNGTGIIHYNESHATLPNQTWIKNYTASGDIHIAPNNQKALTTESNGDVQFYEDTGTTAKMVWDASAESLGIGRANPRASLDFGVPTLSSTLSTTLSDYQVMLEAPSGTGNYAHNIGWSESTGSAVTVASINAVDDGSSSATGITFATGDNSSITERMRIDSSGNVRINSDSAAASGSKSLQFWRGSAERGRLKFDFSNSSMNLQADGVMTFMTAGENERARIDSSGNLLVGTTNSEGKKLSIRDSYGISDETTKTITLTVAMGGSKTKNIGTFTGNAGATCSVHLIGGHHYATASTGTSAPVGVIQMMAVTRLDGTGSVYSSINNVEVASSIKGGVALPTLEFTSSGLLRVVTAANQGCYAQLTIVHHGTFTR